MPSERPKDLSPAVRRLLDRRRFLMQAAAGTVVGSLAGTMYGCAPDAKTVAAREEPRTDGRPRLPPGQRLLEQLKPMGGREGNPDPAAFHLTVSGEVSHPLSLNYTELLALPQVEQKADVHCVTGWSMFDGLWKGVAVEHLAKLAGVKSSARFAIFEAAFDYTTNVPLEEALEPSVLVAYRLNGDPFAEEHGSPVRGLVPDLYFWKSAKWLTGIRFTAEDQPGYWEVRGYNNHGDPWREERYARG